MSVSMEKIEPKRLVTLGRNYSYTLGGTAQYYAEIALMRENGYTSTEHSVRDRSGDPLTVAVLHLGNNVVKVYEL